MLVAVVVVVAPGLLLVAAVGSATLGVLSLPFITALHPAFVIDDPGMMFALGGVLAVVACDVAHRRLTGGPGLP